MTRRPDFKLSHYPLPLEEGRKVIDAAMGEKTLTEVLYELRQEAA